MKWALLAFVAVFCFAAPAWAHVTVTSNGAVRGGEAVLSFTVPTESDTASTVGLAVELPHFAEVAVRPHAGWTHSLRRTSAGYELDWRAASAASAIKPGEFDVFDVSVGPLPDADTRQLRRGADATATGRSWRGTRWPRRAAAPSRTTRSRRCAWHR